MKKKGVIRAVVVTIVIIVLLAFNNIKNNNIDYNFNSLKSLEYQVVQAGDETEDTYVITIVDPDSRQPLEGVKIDITDLGGDSVLDDGVAETDEYGKIRVNLYPGKYNVVIVEGIEGYYFADETTQITIDEKRYELRYVGKFGKSMLAPRKMVTVEDGIIVVGNGVYIAKYDFNGNLVWKKDDEEFRYTEVAVVDGGVIAVSPNGGGVTKFDLNGNVIWRNTEINQSGYKLEIIEDGILVEVENSLVKLDLEGNFVRVIVDGYIPGNLGECTAINNGFVISIGKEMTRYTLDGEVVWKINILTNIPENTWLDAMEATDDLIVVYTSHHYITAYNYDGEVVWNKSNPRQFQSGFFSIVDEGIVLFEQMGGLEVVLYDFNGNYIKRINLGDSIYSGCVLNDGIYAVGESVYKFDLNGSILWENSNITYCFYEPHRVSDGIILVNTAPSSSSKIVKCDFNGNILWENDCPNTFYEELVEVSDGIVIICSGKVIKYDLNGNIVWENDNDQNKFEDFALINNKIFAVGKGKIVEIDLDGNVENTIEDNQITNISSIIPFEDSFIVIGDQLASKYNFNGELIWNKSDILYYDYYRDKDGFIAVSGGSIAYYNSDGELLWKNDEKEMPEEIDDWEYWMENSYWFNNIVVGEDGIYAISGNGQIVKYNLNGNIVWERRKDNREDRYLTVAEVDGEIILISEYSIEKVDNNGNVVWCDNYTYAIKGGFESNGDLIAIESPGKPVIRYSKYLMNPEVIDTYNISIEAERQQYKIITSVDGIGGTISGQGSTTESPYESVYYGENSLKDIVVTPNPGFKISSITVNEEAFGFSAEEDGTYTLPKFNVVEEDKHIVVKFEAKDTRVVVKHQTEQGGDIVSPEYILGKVGDEYTTSSKDFPTYDVKVTPDNAQGNMTEEEITVVYVYSKVLGKVTVTKQDKNNSDIKLEGAIFKLEKVDEDNNVYESFDAIEKTTSEQGKAIFDELEVGRYRITEIKAPEGYELTNEQIIVEITKAQREANVTAGDRLKLELPTTGKINYTILISLIGFSVLLTSIGTVVIRRKNNYIINQ